MAKSGYKGITVDIEFQGKTSKFNEAVGQMDKTLKGLDSELTQVNKGLKLDPTNAALVGQKFELLRQKIGETEEKLKLMRSAQKEVENAYKNGEIDGGTYRDFQRELAKTEAQLKSLNGEVKRTAEALTADMKRAVSDLKNELSGMADIIKKGELAMLAFTASSAKVGAGFESGMSQVAATLQTSAGSEEYAKLSAAAKEMGESTSYSAAQAASALNSLAQAGYTADEAVARLPKTLALAKAGGLDLANAAKIVTQSMASLQLSEEELDKLLDEMARTGQKSNTNIAELGEAIKTVGGTIDMAGQSMETMFTELGMLANAGVAASEAGTHLRNILLSLVKTDVQSSLHDMGVEVVDSTGKVRDLCDIMTDLSEATSSMQSGELIATFGDLFNVRDLSSINALLNGTKGSMQALREEIENSQGAATQMAQTMGDNLTGDVTILKSAVEGLQIAVSERLSPALRKATQEGTEFIGGLTDSVKAGELAATFDRLGETLSKLLKSGLESAANVLPAIVDFLVLVAENFDTILSLYLSMQAYAKSKVIITAVGELIVGVISLTNAIRSAETAQALFNATAAANPVGAIATAGAALFAGLTFAITKASAAIDETNGELTQASAEIQEYADNVEKLNDEIIQTKQAHEDNLDNISKERSELSALADTVSGLAEKQKLSAGEYEILQKHIDALNKAVPGLSLAFDSQTGALNMTREAMLKLVKSYEAYQELQARIDYGADLRREQVESQDSYDVVDEKFREVTQRKKDLENDLARIETERAVLSAKLTDQNGLWTDDDIAKDTQLTRRYEAVSQALEQTSADYRELGLAHIEARESLESLNEKLSDNGEKIEELTTAAGDYSETLAEQTAAEEKKADAEKKSAKTTDDLKEAYKAAQTATSNYRSELKDLLGVLEAVQKGTAYSTSQILDLIDKYPQLAGAIRETADGYLIEADAVRRLTEARAQTTVQAKQLEIAELESQLSKLMIKPADMDTDEWQKQRSALYSQYGEAQELLSAYRAIEQEIREGHIYFGSSSSGSGTSSSSGSTSSSASSTDPYEEELKRRKEAAKSEQAQLEHDYKMGLITATDYYNGLMDVARRYYAGIGELREEYLSAESKVYEGLKKAQEDELSNAKKLEDQLKAVKEAEDALNNAQNQQVSVYNSAAGYHAEINTAAIDKARQTLADKNYSLAETLLKNARYNGESLAERLQSIGLANIRDMLPDLSGLRLPSIGGGTTTNNNSTRNITYNGGDIHITIAGSVDETTLPKLKGTLEDTVRKVFEQVLDEENAQRQTGGL